jgi:CRISPR/Cas system-associated exonuclease Cas4 (RecB family)
MKVYENEPLVKSILDKLSEPSDRTGWHVTDLICCRRKTYYRKIGLGAFVGEEVILRRLRGRSHHSIIEAARDEFSLNEVTFEKDGIVGTVDVMGKRPIEITSTMRSPNSSPLEFEYKIKQMMAYCYMAGVREADFVVFFSGPVPRLKAFTLEFTDEELNSNWRRLKERKSELAKAIADLECPPKEPDYPWECDSCEYSFICEPEALLPDSDF